MLTGPGLMPNSREVCSEYATQRICRPNRVRYRDHMRPNTIATTSPMMTICSSCTRRPNRLKTTIGKASNGKRITAVLETFWAIVSSTRSAPIDETIAENSGALRRRSGRNATTSSATDTRAPVTIATSSATYIGASSAVTV